MGWLSIEVFCDECMTTSGMLVDREERNEPQVCPECGDEANRIISVPHVSTEKLSNVIPDIVAKGRFAGLKEVHEAKKEVAKAKREYATNPSPKAAGEIKRARSEKAKLDTMNRK